MFAHALKTLSGARELQRRTLSVFASTPRFGTFCAISTPFHANLTLDHARLASHASDLLSRGCDGIAVFGTTGEGASIAASPRQNTFVALAEAGIDLRRQVVCGIIASAPEEVLTLCRQALENDCRGLLVAPPFYYKGVSEDALYAWFAHLIENLGAAARDIILYHIPSLSAVPLPLALIERLKRSFPAVIIGVKDSSGDWSHTERLLQSHTDLAILVGDERHLARAMTLGGSGTICGVANIVPNAIGRMVATGEDDRRIGQLVEAIVALPIMAAIKALLAHQKGDPQWSRMRPPLAALNQAQAGALTEAFAQIFIGTGNDLRAG
jgi:4-hydroxy-tetrahydrodipicolinate synthase